MSRPMTGNRPVPTPSATALSSSVSASSTSLTSLDAASKVSKEGPTEPMTAESSDDALVNVVDLEATCFKPWAGETQDIIEVGISVVDTRSGSVLSTRSILVHPTHSAVTPFCTSLTTLTPEQVEAGGITFQQAMRVLSDEYHLATRLFASYGAFDLRLLKRQLQREGVAMELPSSFLNVKKLVAASYKRKECGMMQALEVCRLAHEGVHHRGDDDSRNIGRILLHLLSRHQRDQVVQKSTERVADTR